MSPRELNLSEKAHKAEKIIIAAEKVFFSKGLESSSMDEVARTAQVSKGSLYLYFKNKNALYRAILRRAFEKLETQLNNATLQASGLENVLAISKAYIGFARKHIGYFHAILHYENDVMDLEQKERESVRSMIAGHQVLQILTDSIRIGVDDGSISKHIDVEKTAFVLWGQLTGVLQMLHSKGELIHHFFDISRDQLLKTYYQILLASLENKHPH